MACRASRLAVGLAMAAVLTAPTAAHAASDGNIDGTSTGTLDISLTIPELVRISNLDDIELGVFSGVGDLAGRDDVCVWSTTRAYQITATGSGTGGAFELTGATAGNVIPYQVQWADTAAESSGTALANGAPLLGQATTSASPTCQGGASLNASVIVLVAEGDMTSATAEAYSGTLSLLVEPQ